MARLALNKAALAKQNRLLKTLEEVLPSLDLKRRQLGAEKAKVRQTLAQIQTKLEAIEAQIARELPMLSLELIDLTDIVKVTSVELGEENVMGTRLPKVKDVNMEVQPYAFLGTPFWVDRLVEILKTALALRIDVQVGHRRLDLLNNAERVATQRFNLFDKVLTPQAKANIKKIKVYLADAERAAVVNSKIAKHKKQKKVV
ncbi:MAG: V-type ATP synthase subunit D [Syntrophobacterales bacterium]|jgi:V/A-type H+-transporting ATPase subunit D